MMIARVGRKRVVAYLMGASLLIALGGCAGGARNVWMRPGASAAQGEADREACLKIAEAESRPKYTGGVAAQAGDGFSTTIAKYQRRDACLTERGYALTMISPDETRKLDALQSAEREIYWQELLAKYKPAPAGAATPIR